MTSIKGGSWNYFTLTPKRLVSYPYRMANQERRRHDAHLFNDAIQKRIIVCTICGIVGLFSATICYLALVNAQIPEILDRLTTFVIGNITGMLSKTTADKVADVIVPAPPSAPEIGEAVVDASKKDPVVVDPAPQD